MGLLAALAACTPKQEAPAEKIHTVGEFLHDGDLYKTTLAFCANNPAERQALPNCVNVSEAGMRMGMLPCFGHGVIDHACLEKNGYPR